MSLYQNSGDMKIAHLSDLHICSAPDAIIYGVNPYEHLKRAVSVLKERHDIDLGIITGDISNDGSKRSYEIADEVSSSDTYSFSPISTKGYKNSSKNRSSYFSMQRCQRNFKRLSG